MAILRERKVWRRHHPPPADRLDKLYIREQENVRTAMRALHGRLRTWDAVAKAVGVPRKTIERIMSGERGIPVRLALCAARAARVPVDDVLSGAWPKPGVCPVCGRRDADADY